MVGEMRGRFERWLTRPPRPHGATIVNRRVSFLELFYDLVYVAVIGQTGHQLAEHISVRGVVESAIIFGLTWTPGSTVPLRCAPWWRGWSDAQHRLCPDGILVLLAVFTADASDGDGTAFSMVYAAFLVFTTWLWYAVHRRDRQDRPEFLEITGGMWWPWAFPRSSQRPASRAAT
jgi:low temperature requirement protein LtrA